MDGKKELYSNIKTLKKYDNQPVIENPLNRGKKEEMNKITSNNQHKKVIFQSTNDQETPSGNFFLFIYFIYIFIS